MSYEDLEEARTKRAAKETAKGKGKGKRGRPRKNPALVDAEADTEADVEADAEADAGSPEVEAGKGNRDRKRKNPAPEGSLELEAGLLVPKNKVARRSEVEPAKTPFRAPVARMY